MCAGLPFERIVGQITDVGALREGAAGRRRVRGPARPGFRDPGGLDRTEPVAPGSLGGCGRSGGDIRRRGGRGPRFAASPLRYGRCFTAFIHRRLLGHTPRRRPVLTSAPSPRPGGLGAVIYRRVRPVVGAVAVAPIGRPRPTTGPLSLSRSHQPTSRGTVPGLRTTRRNRCHTLNPSRGGRATWVVAPRFRGLARRSRICHGGSEIEPSPQFFDQLAEIPGLRHKRPAVGKRDRQTSHQEGDVANAAGKGGNPPAFS